MAKSIKLDNDLYWDISGLHGAAPVEKVFRNIGTAAQGTKTTFKLTNFFESSYTVFLIIITHNSTSGSNGMWIFRKQSGNAFPIANASNITIVGTAGAGEFAVTSSSGTVAVYAAALG